ncbi:hypothetical protein D3C72_933810 [compost metagenome]
MPIGLFSSWRLTLASTWEPSLLNSADTAQLVPWGSTRAEVIMVPSRPVSTQSLAPCTGRLSTVGAPPGAALAIGEGVATGAGLPVGKSALWARKVSCAVVPMMRRASSLSLMPGMSTMI